VNIVGQLHGKKQALALTRPMAQDSIALQKQQLLVNITGQGDFSACEANCAMALLCAHSCRI